MDVARYARSVGIHEELVFKLWVPYIMKKATAIKKAVISRLCASKTKFAIKIPDSLDKFKELKR